MQPVNILRVAVLISEYEEYQIKLKKEWRLL